MNELAIFAGAGGGILGGVLLGWRTVCAVEIDPYARRVLLARQNDGCLPTFPVFDDVRSFDGRPWRGRVDIISGGFPCQDISCAGTGKGIDGPKSGLWKEMLRIICEIRPRFAFVENSPMLLTRGIGRILGELAEVGYDAPWACFSGFMVGAWHKRERVFIAPNIDGVREPQPEGREQDKRERISDVSEREGERELANAVRQRLQDRKDNEKKAEKQKESERGVDGWEWWSAEPELVRMVYGIPAGVDRIRCLGNAQLPQMAAYAWRCLSGRAAGGE